jgi:hypothetical protein
MGADPVARLAVDALATVRLTRLAMDDDVTQPIRDWLQGQEDAGRQWAGTVNGALDCPWCTSVWAGLAVAGLRRLVPKVWAPIAEGLAWSLVTGELAERQ